MAFLRVTAVQRAADEIEFAPRKDDDNAEGARQGPQQTLGESDGLDDRRRKRGGVSC